MPASSDVTICGADGETALKALPPGEDLLLCPEVIHDFQGVYRGLGDMQGSTVRSSVPGTLAPVRGTLNFLSPPTHNLNFKELHMDNVIGSGHAFRFDDGITNITIEDSIIERYDLAAYVRKRSGERTQRGIKFYRNIIRDNTHQGILGGGPGLEIVDNVFIDNGSNGFRDHGIYFGCGDPGDGSACPQLISGNYITGSSRSSSGDCQGSQIVGHGYMNGTIIENNIAIEPEGKAAGTCYGIDITECCGNGPLTNLIIRNNIIANNGRVGIAIRGVTGVDIYGNIIFHHKGDYGGSKSAIQAQPPQRSNYPTGDLNIYDNIIDMSGRVGTGIDIWEGVNPPVVIANNTEVYDDTSIFDINQDGALGIEDLAIMLNKLGTTGGRSDIDRDGVVGLEDVGLFLRMYHYAS
tara:strand:+ start:186 stop:1409 length:1224 start_codon:yes stop_codon:yes gene_type:complete